MQDKQARPPISQIHEAELAAMAKLSSYKC